MSCNRPLSAVRYSDGQIGWSECNGDVVERLKLPCGKCLGCRLERARQWSVRIMHESRSHEDNCFITLTYNDEHLPFYNNLDYRDFQLFMKRMRKLLNKPIRFFCAGEYGGNYGRPHFHACIFGHDFKDLEVQSKSEFGSIVYRSSILEKLWPFGFSSVGSLTRESAAYVARYIVKKQSDVEDSGLDVYDDVNVETGEVFRRNKEFVRMSLKPGVGRSFYDRWWKDMFPGDIVVDSDGTVGLPPKYYLNRLKLDEPEMYESVVNKRIERGLDKWKDNIKDRLDAKEKILQSRNMLLKRNLK